MITRILAAGLFSGLSVAASAGSYYLALGDSVAFGYENSQSLFMQSNGDRGYVAPVADALKLSTGVRPTVLNLAIAGETSVSFADRSNIASLLNSNYNGSSPRPDQEAFAKAQIASLGAQIGTVSFAIGANDYLGLSSTDQGDPVALAAAFSAIQARYTSVLDAVRGALPNAILILPGYYNPYAPGTTQHDRAASALLGLNTIVQGYASQYGGRYVDFYTPIEGKQATLIGTNDIHPNDTGYAVLGRAAAQAVPEPSSFAAVGLGLVALARRRRR